MEKYIIETPKLNITKIIDTSMREERFALWSKKQKRYTPDRFYSTIRCYCDSSDIIVGNLVVSSIHNASVCIFGEERYYVIDVSNSWIDIVTIAPYKKKPVIKELVVIGSACSETNVKTI